MTHQSHTMHGNSLSAFASLDLATRRQAVLAAYGGGWKTDREISEILGAELYTTRPRITECVKDGVLIEVGSGIDHVTGKRVRLCATAEAVFIKATP